MKKQTGKITSRFISKTLNVVTFLVTTLSSSLPRNIPVRAIAFTISSLPALASLSLEDVQRVLVISPHPDDETIAPGGLIQAALANRAEVRVVIVTNGDGQPFAPVLFGLEGGPLPGGYISMGKSRQVESIAALGRLGVPAKSIIFLGYPDRGLQPMLEENWEPDDPYTSLFTRASSSPYTGTYQPSAAYCGLSLFSDLRRLVSDYRPDLVVLPHPADQHSDHAATSIFTTNAVAAVRTYDPTYKPMLWAYLVHYGEYPVMGDVDRSMGFFPPSELITENDSWGVLALTTRQVQEKSAAIEEYPTQTLLLGKFLPEFTRPNELFMIVAVDAGGAQMIASLNY